MEQLGNLGINSNIGLIVDSDKRVLVGADEEPSVDQRGYVLQGGCDAGHAPARGRSRLGGIVARYRPT